MEDDRQLGSRRLQRRYGPSLDEAVDAGSSQPGLHKLEKMMSGAYASELFRQTLLTYFGVQELPPFTTEAMNASFEVKMTSKAGLRWGSCGTALSA